MRLAAEQTLWQIVLPARPPFPARPPWVRDVQPSGSALVHGDWHLSQLTRLDDGGRRLIDVDDLGTGDPVDPVAVVDGYGPPAGPPCRVTGDPRPRLAVPDDIARHDADPGTPPATTHPPGDPTAAVTAPRGSAGHMLFST